MNNKNIFIERKDFYKLKNMFIIYKNMYNYNLLFTIK